VSEMNGNEPVRDKKSLAWEIHLIRRNPKVYVVNPTDTKSRGHLFDPTSPASSRGGGLGSKRKSFKDCIATITTKKVFIKLGGNV
jgi:hypothetical protein